MASPRGARALAATVGLLDHACIEENGNVLTTAVRVDRVSLFAGPFYGVWGCALAEPAPSE